MNSSDPSTLKCSTGVNEPSSYPGPFGVGVCGSGSCDRNACIDALVSPARVTKSTQTDSMARRENDILKLFLGTAIFMCGTTLLSLYQRRWLPERHCFSVRCLRGPLANFGLHYDAVVLGNLVEGRLRIGKPGDY